MNRISISRKLEFDAAHRVVGHEGKCKYLHGHRYVLEAEFSAKHLDEIGRVVDFSVIKDKLGLWIDENWDHNTILWSQDKKLGSDIAKHTKKKPFYLPNNPTAENMALYLRDEVCPLLFKDEFITCMRLTLHETPNCKVTLS